MLRTIHLLRPLFSRRDKLIYLGLFVMMAGGAVLNVLGVGVIPVFVATLAVPDQVFGHPLAGPVLESLGLTTTQDLIVWGCALMLVVYVLKNAYLAAMMYAQVRITEHHRVRLSTLLFRAYMYAPYEFHLERNSAELLRNADVEAKQVITAFIRPLMNTILGVLMLLGIVVLLFAAMPLKVMAVVAFVIGGSWVFLRVVRVRLRTYGVKARAARKDIIQNINQGLGCVAEARILGRTDYFVDATRRSLMRFARMLRKYQVINKSTPFFTEITAVIGLLAIVLLLFSNAEDPAAIIPQLALFGAAVLRVRGSLSQVTAGITQLSYAAASVETVAGELSLLRNRIPQERLGPRAPLPFQDALRVRDLSYAYPGADRPALQGIDLEVPRGHSVALVGATGSGKSTLVSVLLGLLTPERGTIEVDGVSIHDHLDAWQRNVGYVPQAITLLDDTVRRNVAFGLEDADIEDGKVWAALDAAQIGDFVRSLPRELDATVGERGARISGGQRQRIGLARALYHNPEVVVLDEATSALDNRTEDKVMRAIEAMHGERTVIIIAHRLSTVERCDCLYLLDDGELVAQGTYAELASNQDKFAEMVSYS